MHQVTPAAARRCVIAVASAKGGTGKTSLAANLGTALAMADWPVAIIDLDPQDALYAHLDPVGGHGEGIVGASLAGDDWSDVARFSPHGAMIVPYGKVSITAQRIFERTVEAQPDWLARGLDSLGLAPDSIVILDVATTPGAASVQGLVAADLVVTPLLVDAASYTTVPAMRQLLDAYPPHRGRSRSHVYLMNQLEAADELSRDVARLMRRECAGVLVGEVVRDPVFRQAHASRCSIFDYDATSRGASDVLACARWLAAHLPVAQDA
jgi:cellulose synthase operon protein YhjQ